MARSQTSDDQAGAGAVILRLVSWNVHGLPHLRHRARRLRLCIEAISKYRPSAVVLQEVWTHADAALMTRALADAGFQPVGVPDALGFRAAGLLALVDRTRWRIGHSTYRRFAASAPAWRIWEGDGLMRKGLQVVPLVDADGRRITLINTHLQAEYSPAGARTRYASIRQAQLEQLLEAASTAQADAPVLIAGDFNTSPDETRLYSMLLRAGWIDLTHDARTSHCRGSHVEKDGSEPNWIDYVFAVCPPGVTASADVRLILNTARDVPYSDHHGIAADITIS